ncbi:hypothetical protein [Rhizobium lusitanum]|uniref:Purine-nucleoside phosphorylase n=1 Tax=Rhizobium lusitanum TaxID=293958 RepID=A0A7X0IWL5_9HYPH|nr:hypothetical protein [Rhizobium lusitanum]MBB6488479.1 purine-nucleoside phosphorylase [Rhizobium lusitanum]
MLQFNILGRLRTDADFKRLRLFTTAALMAEGRKEVEDWRKDGFDAVDMESAAVFSVAECFNMRKGSMLFVSDQPYSEKGLLHTERDDRLLERVDDSVIELILAFLEKNNRVDIENIQTGA